MLDFAVYMSANMIKSRRALARQHSRFGSQPTCSEWLIMASKIRALETSIPYASQLQPPGRESLRNEIEETLNVPKNHYNSKGYSGHSTRKAMDIPQVTKYEAQFVNAAAMAHAFNVLRS